MGRQSVSQNGRVELLSAFGYHSEPHFAFLYIKDCVRLIALGEDGLIFRNRHDRSAFANRREESVGIELASVDEGLELASVNWVDLVIIDYFMPEMSGQEVASEIRKVRPWAPIILLAETVDIPHRALELVDALVAKDRLASELLPTIAQLHGCGPTLPFCLDA